MLPFEISSGSAFEICKFLSLIFSLFEIFTCTRKSALTWNIIYHRDGFAKLTIKDLELLMGKISSILRTIEIRTFWLNLSTEFENPIEKTKKKLGESSFKRLSPPLCLTIPIIEGSSIELIGSMYARSFAHGQKEWRHVTWK